MQGMDDLVFSLELNLARKASSEDDMAEQVEKRQLTFRCVNWWPGMSSRWLTMWARDVGRWE